MVMPGIRVRARAEALVPLPRQLERMDEERRGRYRDLLEFYEGRQWPGRARRGERRLTFNYGRAFVDKITSYLMTGATVQVEAEDAETEAGRTRARAAELRMRAVEAELGLGQLDYETEVDCAILGDAAYRVTWDVARGRLRVTAPDVQALWAWRDPADPTALAAVALQYSLEAGQPVTARTAPPTLMTEHWTAESFTLYRGTELAEATPNPYGFIPFVVFPNVREPKQGWGASDLTPLIEPARELNRAFSQLSMILELSGNPIAVIEGVTGSQDIAVEPGAIWEVPERARAYLLDLLQGGGVALHREYIDLLYRALHDLGESPRTAFGHNEQGLSGVALNTELDPLAKKVARKRLIRTAVYERRAMLMLRLLAQFEGLDIRGLRPVMQWGPVLPIDRSRQVSEERSLVEAGIHSRRTAAARLGAEDADGEWARVLAERAALEGSLSR